MSENWKRSRLIKRQNEFRSENCSDEVYVLSEDRAASFAVWNCSFILEKDSLDVSQDKTETVYSWS